MTSEDLSDFRIRVFITFLAYALFSNVTTFVCLWAQLFTKETALAGIPLTSLLLTLYFKKTTAIPDAALLGATLGLLSAFLQPAYMILGK